MEILNFNNYEIKFFMQDKSKVEKFKDKFYSILTLFKLSSQDFYCWNSAHVEEGSHGHIVFSSNDFNFILKLSKNFTLTYFAIYNHIQQTEKIYFIFEYNKLYKEIVSLI